MPGTAAAAASFSSKACLILHTVPTPSRQMCDNVVRHRLTLGLRAERAWRRARAALLAAATAPLRLLAECVKWLVLAVR